MNVYNRAIDWRNLRRQLSQTSIVPTLVQASSSSLEVTVPATQLLVELNRTVPDATFVAMLLNSLSPLFTEEQLTEIATLTMDNNVVLPEL